ncbi:hypothetical protein T459_21594 [Capsicum annuum]|uniref:ABC transporter domain-containing protein n=1 Tax=Capsicum annuum TaxID=4072 RepID=A0A2G2YX31_CAPAN|nr:hypothetical protein T459_21594 [Capsicum annuum]
MFQTIDRPIDPYDMKGQKLVDISGDIELKNVHCCCPARLNESIFDGLSISILKGTTTALVGRIGSGKSTVIGLIIRFYDPQAGEVLIDGINIKEFQLRWIRGKIGLVSQKPVLFGSTIKDNIAYGKGMMQLLKKLKTQFNLLMHPSSLINCHSFVSISTFQSKL